MLRLCVYTVLVSLLVPTLPGCGGSDGGGGTKPGPSLVDQGWAAFEAGDFATAASRFAGAIASDPTDEEAHNGMGWTRLEEASLAAAVASFDAALTNGFAGADPHAGRAIVLRDADPVDYAAAIAAATAALAIDGGYVFAHDTTVDWRDLRLVLAQSHFGLSEYDLASQQVTLLGGTPPSPQSDTFVEDLLAVIEQLAQSIVP